MITQDIPVSIPAYFQVVTGYSVLEEAVLRAVAYADVFNYPLKGSEIARYLVGVQATQAEVDAALGDGSAIKAQLRFDQGFWTLEGRESLVALRRRRLLMAARRWPVARRYGRWIAALPFVRMVAVTGALAVDNEDGPDLDYLVVTAPGRLWLCRGMVMLLVHWARRYGDEVCPNYFLSQSALALNECNLYSAHEMAQMVPLSGFDIYERLRELNPWVAAYLPNATGQPPRTKTAIQVNSLVRAAQQTTERLLRLSPGNWVEDWEMRRKVRKLGAQKTDTSEADFSEDWCKGHFGGYGWKTQHAYRMRLHSLSLKEDMWNLG